MDKGMVKVQETRAMVYIPENSIELEITATIYVNGEVQKVAKVLNLQETRKAIEDADENYIEDDDVFTLTDYGKKYADRLLEKD